MPSKILLTAQEVSKLLKVSVPTVHRLAKDHGLESILVGGQRRFTEEAIDDYLTRQTQAPKPALAPRRSA